MEIVLKVVMFLLIYALGEVLVSGLVFRRLNKYFQMTPKRGKVAIWKGLLERFMLYLGLAVGIQQVLIVFGALKVGTYLHTEGEDQKLSKDYYLIGNVLSITFAIFYMLLYERAAAFITIDCLHNWVPNIFVP